MAKTLFLNSCPKWGGGEKWFFDTASALEQRGLDVVMASIKESELYQKSKKYGLTTKAVSVRGTFSAMNPFKLWSFVDYLKKEKITTLILNLSQDLKFGAVAGKLAGVEQIIYYRGSAFPIQDRWYTRILLRDWVTDIIANSQATKKTILKNTSHWLDDDKIKIIYNGIKLNKIDEANIETDIREEFNIGDDEIVVANVGRLSREKGQQYLIEAVDLLSKKIDKFKVLIVGKGNMRPNLERKVKELELEEYIVFTGFRTDVYSIMKQIDFLVHTSLWEGFGFVIAEAMAVSKPVVSTNIGAIPELIREGETGYLAESEAPVDIADKMLKMIENNNKTKMGELGRQIVKENFAFKNQIDKLLNIMNE